MLDVVRTGILAEMDLSSFYVETDRIALIDADSALYYCMGEVTFEAAKIKLDKFMFNLLETCGTSKYAGFLTPHKTFRNSIGYVKPYKGNRSGKKTPPIYYGLKAYAEQEWNFVTVQNLEADDCVSLHRGKDMVICSPDKDVLKQIPGTHYDYFNNIWVTTSNADAWRFLWLQCTAGDSVDCIPGIPGIGMIKAGKALEGVAIEDHPLQVLKMYIELSGGKIKESVDRFKESLDLVYVLKERADLDRLGISLPALVVHDIKDIYSNGTP